MNISRSRGRERKLTDRPNSRPKSEYAAWEDPPAEGEPFDYDAEPSRFYFQVESAGNLVPDAIIQEGIKELQRKLAALIHGLGENDATMAGEYEGPRSPDMDGAAAAGWQAEGYTTPYGNPGAASSWGGAATAYGTTPYGNSGSGGWS